MRKINNLLWMVLAVICLVAVSCDRDGVYRPKKKISKIHYDNGWSGKRPYSSWSWNGNKLNTIRHRDGSELQFFYDGKLVDSVSLVNSSRNGYYKFTYDGKKHLLVAVDHYTVFWNEPSDLKVHYEFIYNEDNRISEMNIESYSVFDKSSGLENELFVLQTALPQIPIQFFSRLFSEARQTKSFLGAYHGVFEYEGENVSKCTITCSDNYTETYHFTYSHVKNPFYNLLNYGIEWPFPYITQNQYMLSSLTSTQAVIDGNEESVFSSQVEYDYEVEDDYPTRMTYRTHSWFESPSSLDTTTSTDIYYFEYLD